MISLIIPAYNEGKYLTATLDSVEKAIEILRKRDARQVELIVADNGSTDSTAGIAREFGAKVVTEEERRIASVRNTGARASRGNVLAFLDADCRMTPNLLSSVHAAMSSGKYLGGGTDVRIDRDSFGIFCTYCITRFPARWLLGVAGGMIFVTRSAFEMLGGFDETLYCGEDMKFILDLRKAAKASGREFKIINDGRVIASSRAFDRFGDWYYFKHLPAMLLNMRSAFRDREFAKRFWYDAER